MDASKGDKNDGARKKDGPTTDEIRARYSVKKPKRKVQSKERGDRSPLNIKILVGIAIGFGLLLVLTVFEKTSKEIKVNADESRHVTVEKKNVEESSGIRTERASNAVEIESKTEIVAKPAEKTEVLEEVAKKSPNPIVELETEPQHALVTIAGLNYGYTPLELSLSPGTYEITISKMGYKKVIKQAELWEGRNLHYLISLEIETENEKETIQIPLR